MKPEFARVCALLTDTVTLLCKNGVTFSTELKIQGVIGITVDAEVFVVHINELYGEGTELYNATDLHLKADVAKISSHSLVPSSFSSRPRQKSKHPIKFPSLKNIVKTEPSLKVNSDCKSEYPSDAKYDEGEGGTSNRYDDDSKDKSPKMRNEAVFDVDNEDESRQYGSTSLTDIDEMKQGFEESWARNSSDEPASGQDSWDRNVDVPSWQSYSLSAGASGSASSMLQTLTDTPASGMLYSSHRARQRIINNSSRLGATSAFLTQQGFRRQRVNASPGSNPVGSLRAGSFVHVDGRSTRGGRVRTGSVSKPWKSLVRVVCEICCRSFTRRSSLIRHQTHMHAWHDAGDLNGGGHRASVDLNDEQQTSAGLNGSQQVGSEEGTSVAESSIEPPI